MDSQQVKLLLATAIASSSLTYFLLNSAKSSDQQQDQQQGRKNKESLAMRLARSNIKSLMPYRCARDDYDTGVLLDANEVSGQTPQRKEGTLRREGRTADNPYQITMLQESLPNQQQPDD